MRTNIVHPLLVTVGICALPCTALADTEDTEAEKTLSGYAETEVNYGRTKPADEPERWDFPHVVLGATLQLGKGWSVSAEFEYERMREDGQWENNFDTNFATNFFYIQKRWNETLGVRAGIVGVPIGLTNNGGPALTIYDPESEASLLPMTWHESGATFFGSAAQGKVDYQLSLLTYIPAPLSHSRFVGAAARGDYHFSNGINAGLSAFWGNTAKGMVSRELADFSDHNRLFTAAIDASYEENGWVADGSYIYNSASNAESLGLEVGRDIAPLISSSLEAREVGIIPFARYDGVYNTAEADLNKYTLGLNVSAWKGFIFKAEYAWRNLKNAESTHGFDLSVGYGIEF